MKAPEVVYVLRRLEPVREIFNPKIKFERKYSEAGLEPELSPIEAWNYLLGLIEYLDAGDGKPSPAKVLDILKKMLESDRNNLNKKCMNASKLKDNIDLTLSIIDNLLNNIDERSKGLAEGEDFANLAENSKKVGELLIRELYEASQQIAEIAGECSKRASNKRCCNEIEKLASNLYKLAVDVRPLLDTCYDSEKAMRLYGNLNKLVEAAKERGDNLDQKLVAVIVSVIALELAGRLGEELRWLLDLVVESLGIDRWLWPGDLAAVLYASSKIIGDIPEKVKITRDDAAEILKVLAGL